MKVEDKRDGVYVEYGTLKFGEAFEYDNDIWIRINNRQLDPDKNDEAVSLLDGEQSHFDSDCLIKHVEAKVVIE